MSRAKFVKSAAHDGVDYELRHYSQNEYLVYRIAHSFRVVNDFYTFFVYNLCEVNKNEKY